MCKKSKLNIFVLDLNPELAAQYHCDKHVVKMILETTQLLCNAHHINGINPAVETILYKKTHINNPCTKWVKNSSGNYKWLTILGQELCKEYTKRYGKVHKCQSKIEQLSIYYPLFFPNTELTEFVQVMPERYKHADVVIAYRNLYRYEKANILKYKLLNKPFFL